MKNLTKKNSQLGFSLIEIAISIGILSTISLGVAYNVANLYKSQNMVADSAETKNFSNNLADYLGSNEFCENELVGEPSPGNNPRPIRVDGLGGMTSGTNDIRRGQEIMPGIRISDLSIQRKAGVTPQQVFDGTNNLNLFAVTVTIGMQNSDPQNPGDWMDLRPQTVDIPVLAFGGTIRACGMSAGLDPSLTCAAIGSTYDAGRGACEPQDTCNLRGTYITWTCNPGHGGCGQGSGLGSGGNGIPNPVTGGVNCPPGATPELSGMRVANYSISCGKKCSFPVREVTRFFVCMECS